MPRRSLAAIAALTAAQAPNLLASLPYQSDIAVGEAVVPRSEASGGTVAVTSGFSISMAGWSQPDCGATMR